MAPDLLVDNPIQNVDSDLLIDLVQNFRGPIVITSCALEDNPIIYCNKAFLDLTGYTYSEIIGKNCRFLQGNDTDQSEVSKIRHAVQTQEHIQVTFKNYRKDGSLFWNDLMITPLKNIKGEVTHFAGMQLDITERMIAEEKIQAHKLKSEQLREQKNKLIQINKSKDEFIAIASHQLRTPATAVKQYLSMLLEGFLGEMDEDQRSVLVRAFASNNRQLDALNELLKTAKLDSSLFQLHKTKEDITDLILESINDLKPITQLKRQKIHLIDVPDSEKSTLSTNVDRNELKLAIEMLLENASKYSDKNTDISVRIRVVKSKLEIVIKDQGVGIEKADLKKIFDKFTRIDNRLSTTVSGTGLGLYWVKRIVLMHKGSISVKSTLGSGSEFIVRLPL